MTTQEAPKLVACPRCALKVQRGKGPGGLAWHDCVEVEKLRAERPAAVVAPALTVAEALERLLHIAVDKAPSMPAKDVVALVAHVGRLHVGPEEVERGGTKGRKGAGSLLAFLRSDDPGDEASGPDGAPDGVGDRAVG